MSFRLSNGESGRAFESVRRSLLQADDLPFADVLTAMHLAEVFESEGISIPDDDTVLIYTPAVTMRAFLSQMLLTGDQRSCVAAVARVSAAEALRGEWSVTRIPVRIAELAAVSPKQYLSGWRQRWLAIARRNCPTSGVEWLRHGTVLRQRDWRDRAAAKTL